MFPLLSTTHAPCGCPHRTDSGVCAITRVDTSVISKCGLPGSIPRNTLHKLRNLQRVCRLGRITGNSDSIQLLPVCRPHARNSRTGLLNGSMSELPCWHQLRIPHTLTGDRTLSSCLRYPSIRSRPRLSSRYPDNAHKRTRRMTAVTSSALVGGML
jgi:hypothetical protein